MCVKFRSYWLGGNVFRVKEDRRGGYRIKGGVRCSYLFYDVDSEYFLYWGFLVFLGFFFCFGFVVREGVIFEFLL